MRSIDVTKLKRPANVDSGPAPMLQWIRIEQLVVDDSYQRDLKAGNWKTIQRIAEAFRWSRFSPVFVAPVEGGRFAIIDGQHRTHAAAICGFAEVPCQVVQMSLEEQAASFAAVNGLVTKVTLQQIFKAALTAGETWAIECDRICRDAG
ncbi:ParB N-terminal domain-containing protein [Aquamicrobium zhengzhouense]|uniref:ParB N-terminal domain-containing protein n=1 Tax=Aquamicrobium zhengzhouense TaxID=2781738 RepID=A0ABS0S9X7_9HYPH|nr:ParB N-terminal domain-containing protein [Aquamicrobium zhengzhouense]MBI1620099.1 ParB N-terminal domain-containing protein [Aquamicrobium zhengzhouense]